MQQRALEWRHALRSDTHGKVVREVTHDGLFEVPQSFGIGQCVHAVFRQHRQQRRGGRPAAFSPRSPRYRQCAQGGRERLLCQPIQIAAGQRMGALAAGSQCGGGGRIQQQIAAAVCGEPCLELGGGSGLDRQHLRQAPFRTLR